jgi:hypothetical protein
MRVLMQAHWQEFPPGITFGSKVAFYFDIAGAYLSMRETGTFPGQAITVAKDCIWPSSGQAGFLFGWATGQRDAFSTLKEAQSICEQNSKCCGVTQEAGQPGTTSGVACA